MFFVAVAGNLRILRISMDSKRLAWAFGVTKWAKNKWPIPSMGMVHLPTFG